MRLSGFVAFVEHSKNDFWKGNNNSVSPKHLTIFSLRQNYRNLKLSI